MFHASRQMIILLAIINYNLPFASSTSQSCNSPGIYDRCWLTYHAEPYNLPTSYFTINQSCYNPYFKVSSYWATTNSPQTTQQGIIFIFTIDSDATGTYISYTDVLKQSDDSFVTCGEAGHDCQWQNVVLVDDDLTGQLSSNVIHSQLQINITSVTNFLQTADWYSELYCYDNAQITSYPPTNNPIHSTTTFPCIIPTIIPANFNNPTSDPVASVRAPTAEPTKYPIIVGSPTQNPTQTIDDEESE